MGGGETFLSLFFFRTKKFEKFGCIKRKAGVATYGEHCGKSIVLLLAFFGTPNVPERHWGQRRLDSVAVLCPFSQQHGTKTRLVVSEQLGTKPEVVFLTNHRGLWFLRSLAKQNSWLRGTSVPEWNYTHQTAELWESRASLLITCLPNLANCELNLNESHATSGHHPFDVLGK